jgi:hypothetical protein
MNDDFIPGQLGSTVSAKEAPDHDRNTLFVTVTYPSFFPHSLRKAYTRRAAADKLGNSEFRGMSVEATEARQGKAFGHPPSWRGDW